MPHVGGVEADMQVAVVPQALADVERLADDQGHPGKSQEYLTQNCGQVDPVPGVCEARRQEDGVTVDRDGVRDGAVLILDRELPQCPRPEQVRRAPGTAPGIQGADIPLGVCRRRRPRSTHGEPQPAARAWVIITGDLHDGGQRRPLAAPADHTSGIVVPADGDVEGQVLGVSPGTPHGLARVGHPRDQRVVGVVGVLCQDVAVTFRIATLVRRRHRHRMPFPPVFPAQHRPPAVRDSVADLIGDSGVERADRRHDLLAHTPDREGRQRVDVVRPDDEGAHRRQGHLIIRTARPDEQPTADHRLTVELVAVVEGRLDIPRDGHRRINRQHAQVRRVGEARTDLEECRQEAGQPDDTAVIPAL